MNHAFYQEAQKLIDAGDFDEYLSLFESSKTMFTELFDQYYEKMVLPLPTLEERWTAYLRTPAEWLKNCNYVSSFDDDIEIEINGEKVTLGVVRHLYDSYGQNRHETWDAETVIERFVNLEDGIINGEPETINYWSSREGQYMEIVVTQEMIDLWKQKMIEQRIGAITMDW